MQKNRVRADLLLLSLTLMLAMVPQRGFAGGYAVTVNGATVPGAMAEMRGGQLMVAVRPVAEAMGGDVTWLQSAQRATVAFGGSRLAVWLGNRLGYQDGTQVWAPVSPYFKEDRTMVPGWWLAARLGAQVRFENGTLHVQTAAVQRSAAPTHPLMNRSYFFPLLQGATYERYYDGYGDPRSYQGNNFGHEGIDIVAPKGTPIVAVASGTILRYGWNTLGGYRLNIQLDDQPNYRFYYAHMDRYAPGMYEGAHVRAGQIIGYIGSTGEGPERTEGRFVNHLHFGVYNADGSSIDPYRFLQYWEEHKAQLN